MKKFLLDVTLLALFVAELSFHHLPKVLHEILGVALAAAIVFHVAINFRRFKSLFKKISARKIFGLAINFGLAVGALTILITGVCLSNYLFADVVSFDLRRNMTIFQLHKALPYVMMILIGAHLGLHAQELRQRFFGAKKFSGAVFAALAIVGAFGLYFNRFLDRIFFKHIFATPATELSAPLFMILLLGGIIFFATITFALDKKIFNR